MRYLFIINPAAGKGKAEQLLPLINAYFSQNKGDYHVLVTKGAGDALKASREETEKGGELRVYACGGDGTLNEVVNGVAGYPNTEVGVIPYGTNNDFAHSLDCAEDLKIIEYQVKGTALTVDLIKADDRYVINQCTFGLDALTVDHKRLFEKLPLTGSGTAKASAAYTTLQGGSVRLNLTLNGEGQGWRDYILASCANAPYCGGYKGIPNANPSDGKLNYAALGAVSRVRTVLNVDQYRKGKLEKMNNSFYGECTSMEIVAKSPVPMSLDGEVIYTEHIAMQVMPSAIKVIIPAVCGDKLDKKEQAISKATIPTPL